MEASTWTSDDGITWTDRGTPSFLSADAEWIHIEHRDDTVVANVILDYGSAGGEEIFETFNTARWGGVGGHRAFAVPTLHRVPQHEPDGAGMTAAGATGDILWLVVSNGSGSRTLWIGAFED